MPKAKIISLIIVASLLLNLNPINANPILGVQVGDAFRFTASASMSFQNQTHNFVSIEPTYLPFNTEFDARVDNINNHPDNQYLNYTISKDGQDLTTGSQSNFQFNETMFLIIFIAALVPAFYNPNDTEDLMYFTGDPNEAMDIYKELELFADTREELYIDNYDTSLETPVEVETTELVNKSVYNQTESSYVYAHNSLDTTNKIYEINTKIVININGTYNDIVYNLRTSGNFSAIINYNIGIYEYQMFSISMEHTRNNEKVLDVMIEVEQNFVADLRPVDNSGSNSSSSNNNNSSSGNGFDLNFSFIPVFIALSIITISIRRKSNSLKL